MTFIPKRMGDPSGKSITSRDAEVIPTFVTKATVSAHTNPRHAQLVLESGGQRTTAILAREQAETLALNLLPFLSDEQLRDTVKRRAEASWEAAQKAPPASPWEKTARKKRPIVDDAGWIIDTGFDSSVIKGVAYKMKTNELIVAFHRRDEGSSYTKYVNVPYSPYLKFVEAEALGSYYNAYIKGKYPAMPVDAFPGGYA